jgi:hypothetical protein
MPIAPYEPIRDAYVLHCGPDEMTWEELVGWHLANPLAYVIKQPDFFVMGRAVIKAASPEDIRDLRISFPVESCDAWFLYAFAGNMEKAVAALSDKTHEMRWFAWERFGSTEKELRWHESKRIRQQLTPHGIKTSSQPTNIVCPASAAHGG